MAQQINLYQPQRREQRIFEARSVTATLSVTAAALLLVWQFAAWQVRGLDRQLTALRREQMNQSALMRALGQSAAAQLPPEALQAQLHQVQVQLEQHRRALQLLQSGALGTRAGFAPTLAALARRRVNGLWLDHIVLTPGSRIGTLEGSAVSADLVPRYLRALATEHALVGASFTQLQIGSSEPGSAAVSAHGAGDAGRIHFRAQLSPAATTSG